MATKLDQIVPWGRSCSEYEAMFNISATDLASGILDCGGGPSSFTAELSARGFRSIAIDPIYAFSGAEIRMRFEAVKDSIMSQVLATPDDWTWSFHKTPDDLLAARIGALEKFLTDYEAGRREGCYIVGELPRLPFASDAFGLALCSHLLFLYSDFLTEEFHIQAIKELCRVAREVRIFPLLTLHRTPSPHLPAVLSALHSDGYATEVVRTNYELQRGGNEMLRAFRKR